MDDMLLDDKHEPRGSKLVDLTKLWEDFRTYYPLLFATFGVFLAATAIAVLFMKPTYTATALVGPADNSDQPFSEESGLGTLAKGGLGGIARHLGAGAATDLNDDMFDEYTSLLTSNRLASVLGNKDNILPEIFSNDWDSTNRRWYARDNPISQAADFAKTLLHRSIKSHPDEDDLSKFFEENFTIETSLETSFATVTFKFDNRAEAERILNLILLEADNIIRQDKRRDVAARIAYLNETLAHLGIAEEREELIGILSEQQQEMMMIESDHRYASKLIDPPHAPLKPSSPLPTVDAAIASVLAWLSWIAMVRFTPQNGRWRRYLEKFGRARARKPGLDTQIAEGAER